jgi:hypothetical protein
MAALLNCIQRMNFADPQKALSPPVGLRPHAILDTLQTCLHPNPSEWIFLRELRVGTGYQGNSAQRLDAFALNCYAHTSMKRVCYEIKTSRADFLCELKHPLKRRIGMRYSNEFYFVTPNGLLDISEIPVECGLIEIEVKPSEGPRVAEFGTDTFRHFAPEHEAYCQTVVPAPWRETPGPTWQFVASMLRNQKRVFQERPPKPPAQQRLEFPGSLID